MSTAAQRAGKLSAPMDSISVANAPLDAAPDMGRVISSGKISAGTPIFSPAGARSSVSNSTAPLALNIRSATMTAQRDGRSFTAVESPDLAPEQKESK